MPESFDYFFPAEATQYAFFRMPKMLITDSRFKCISMEAKLLYGILLDRVSLSLENGWVDEKNHVYIIYTIEQIMSDMDCSNRKAIGLLNELERKVALIERKRQGLGRPNLIYVKNFFRSVDKFSEISPEVDNFPVLMNRKTETASFPDMTKSHPEVVTAPRRVGNDICRNDQNAMSASDETAASGRDQKSPADMTESHGIKTDKTKTESNKTDLIISDPMDGDADRYRAEREYLSRSLEIGLLLHDAPWEAETLDGILDLMTDVCCTKRQEIYIGGEPRPADVVRSRFEKMNCGHIRYVLECLHNNSSRVHNIRQYLLAALYNAPTSLGPYWQARANYDMDNSGAAAD